MWERIEERKLDTPGGRAKREALIGAMEIKNYEFNAHGVDMGQVYDSTAIVSDGSKRPKFDRDPELYHQVSTVPGSPLPHAWVGDAQHKASTLDLAPSTRFTLLTGIAGQAWADAVPAVRDAVGIPVEAVVIGPGRQYDDLYYDWARVREIDEDGVLLVRPDKFIAWRSMGAMPDPAAALTEVLTKVLSRG
jgi:2,4-dichlorophenol 6-monooxygenase